MRALLVLEPYLNAGLHRQLRNAIGVGAISISVALSLVAFGVGSVDDGITYRIEPDRIVVAGVSPWGAVSQSTLEPGMVVLRLNQARVNAVATDQDEPVHDPEGWPTLIRQPIDYVEVIAAGTYLRALETGEVPFTSVLSVPIPRSIEQGWPAIVVGILLLVAGCWWLLVHRVAPIRQLGAPALAAAVVPLFLLPLALSWGHGTLLLITVILPLTMWPLADGLAGLLPTAEQRGSRLAILATGLVAMGGGLLLVQAGFRGPSAVLSAGLAGAVLIGPAIPLYRQQRETPLITRHQMIGILELGALTLTPTLAILVLAFRATGLLWLLVFWLIMLTAAQRFTITPLTQALNRNRLQRDLVVEATEAERARIATDLHDVALQELTMLAMRLDAKGDEGSAETAREVAERIRQICGDLRLPLLDDFGVGPALRWLVDRLDEATPGRITLEQNDHARLPPKVELAIFRVAQEGLANALRHGQPPIRVRFEAADDRASLSIDDAGPGLTPDAAEMALQAGRFGLLNMQQRAEQIGAMLAVRRRPTGGTSLAMEWHGP